MPLESLDGQINIHDLATEQEAKPKPEWQKDFETLKNSPLYEEEKNCGSMMTVTQKFIFRETNI